LAFLTNMSEKCTSISHRAIQVKNQWETINIEGKLDVRQCERDEQIVDICCNVRLAYRSICTNLDNADRIKESSKSGTKVLCWSSKTTTNQSDSHKKKQCMGVSYIFIAFEINNYIDRYVCKLYRNV
jgi:hypothetical protein